MIKLYSLRHKLKNEERKAKKNKKFARSWKIQSINRLIKKHKKELVKLLKPKVDTDVVRVLRQDAIKHRNVISIFDSSTIRALNLKINELTDELFIVNVFFFQVFNNIMKNGFIYNGEKYIFFCASAGQIRTKKAVFIKESSFQKIEGQITCGLTLKEINQKGGCNPNKYLAYFSLSNSATNIWKEFDIDKAIVVEDFETDVIGTVDYIDHETYKIERKDMPVPIPHTDGCGMMLDSGTRMVRLPWVKGLMVEFPFDKWLKEKAKPCNYIVTDIYGKKYNIVEDGIKYIFVKSQFKMWNFYDSWDDYKARFKANNCQACYCNLEETYIPNARLNYQFIQSLTDATDREVDRLIKPTIEDIEKIGKDYQTTMRLLGVNDQNPNLSHMQETIGFFPELMRDTYNKEILKDVKKSLVRQAKSGRVRVNGGYRFVCPDLYSFCEHLFLGVSTPKGLLGNGEVYCRGYKNGAELACLRSPHLYREWPIRNNVRNEEIDKWFGMTQCIYTSSHDLITKVVMADCDGDKLLVARDNNLTKVAKRNMEGIVPLYYDMKKAESIELNKDSIYDGMIAAYTTGNIGPYSNNISKIWNCGNVGEQELNVIRWLCMENNFVIDQCKTLYMPTRPPEVDEIIKLYTNHKLPNFFIQAKNKINEQVEKPNNSTMNNLASKIPGTRISYCDTLGRFDYKKLLSGNNNPSEEDKEFIIGVYDYWSRRYNFIPKIENIEGKNDEDTYVSKVLRENIVEECGKSVEYVTDVLAEFYYTKRKNSSKKILWGCFGEQMKLNAKKNLANAKPICSICGKRFKPRSNNNTMYCSNKCLEEAKKEKKINWKMENQ